MGLTIITSSGWLRNLITLPHQQLSTNYKVSNFITIQLHSVNQVIFGGKQVDLLLTQLLFFKYKSPHGNRLREIDNNGRTEMRMD